MKKLLALLLAMAMLFSFVACGGSDDDDDDGNTLAGILGNSSKNSSESDDTDVDISTGTVDSEESGWNEQNKVEVQYPGTDTSAETKVAAYIDSMKDELDSLKESYSSMGLDITIEARGSALVYVYRYTVDIGDISDAKTTLDGALDSSASSFQSVLSNIQSECSAVKSIIVEYQAQDGTVITSREFK